MDQSTLPFLKRFYGHLSTVCVHRHKVRVLCWQLGLYKRGLTHDLSKFSPVEFWAGVKYFQGYRSPIDKEKEVLGYSKGWLHHKGHNEHHWEHWMDIKNGKVVFLECPKEVVKEMVCDRIAASQVYLKENYTDSSALQFFEERYARHIMHPNTAALLEKYLRWVAEDGQKKAFEKIRND